MIPIIIKQMKDNINKNDIISLKFLFSLPIDTSRVKDYIVENLDMEEMSIVLKDIKTNDTYKAKDTELGNIYGRKVSLRKGNVLYQYSYAYNNYKRELVRTNILVYDNDTILEVEVEHPNTMEIFSHEHETFSIRYYVDKRVVYSNTYRNYMNTFFKEENLYSNDVSFNKYFYNINKKNIIYGIQAIESFYSLFHLRGICVLDNNKFVENYLPFTMNKNFYKNNFSDYRSVIYFESFNNLDTYSVAITKDDKKLKCDYKVKDNKGEEIEVKGFVLSIIKEGVITLEEIDRVKEYLEYLTTICDERFLKTVKKELEIFRNKLSNNIVENFKLEDFKKNYESYLEKYRESYDREKLALEKTLNFK